MSAAKASPPLWRSILNTVVEVIFFWQLRIWAWWSKEPPKKVLLEALAEARYFEEWEAAAFQLDELMGNDLWRQNSTSKYYDYRLIYERYQAIIGTREDEDILGLVNLLRSGLVRNLGNITAPRLFNRAYAGTKLLIEDYVTEVALAIEHVTAYPTTHGFEGGLTSQEKLDVLHDTRQAFGRSALVLQGGAIFGLCHIGVVKALHLRGLLPRIIVGTATGALIAALVGVHTEDELLNFLTGQGIDLTAFAVRKSKPGSAEETSEGAGFFGTLVRRVKRFIKHGYFLDVKVLEDCVRANVKDLTFEEAYIKTKRVLNITIPTGSAGPGVPSVLNYITAPNVLIWSAALASNASSVRLYSPVVILCKDPTDNQIYPFSSVHQIGSSSPVITHPLQRVPSTPLLPPSRLPPPGFTSTADLRDSPLSRIRELFNVNHFVVSQARPYIAPFLQAGDVLSYTILRHANNRNRGYFWLPVVRILALEVQHRLHQLDTLGLLHSSIRRFLIDENVPGASLTLVPELNAKDFVQLLRRPNRKTVDEWILRGERSVWPAVGALKVRCAIEVELDRGYQYVRRRKPMDAIVHGGSTTPGNNSSQIQNNQQQVGQRLKGGGEKMKRARASFAGIGNLPKE